MATNELSIMLTAKGNLEGELAKNRDRLRELSKEIRQIQSNGGTVGDDLASEFRTATQAASKLSNELSNVNRDIKKVANESTTAAAKFGRAWMKAADTFNNNFVAGLSTGALLYFGKQAVQTFAQVQDSQAALTATFGKQGEALIAWAKTSGDALNLSQAQAMQAAQTFAIFGESAGLAGQDLVKFSSDLATRAADLASYFGGSTEDAITAIGAALRGEAEPARKYGILLDDLSLKAEYLAITGEKVTGTLTPQQRVLAAQSLVLRQSARAAGDVARTQDSMANRIKDAEQQMADFKATAGETIAVALGPLLEIANNGMRIFAAMPQPIKSAAIAIGLIGTAALIATPRIIAMKTALAQSNIAIGGIGKGGFKAALGITAMMAATRAFADESGNVYTQDNGVISYAEAIRGVTDSGISNGMGKWLSGITDMLVPHNTWWDDASKKVAEFDSELTGLVAAGKQDEAARKFQKMVTEVEGLGGSVEDVKRSLPGYTQALDQAAKAAGEVAGESKDAQGAIDALSGAMDRFAGAADRTKAILDFRDAVKNGLKKPGQEAALDVASAFTSAFGAFEAGSKAQANFVAKNYDSVKKAIENSGLSTAMQKQLMGPLNEAKAQADAIVNSLTANPLVVDIVVPNGAAPVKRAAGGLVTGPGTGTSDSIPALLSNGEYVIRAAAVQSLGLSTLDRINHADKMSDPGLLTKIKDRPQVQVATSQPLIGKIEVHNPQADIDVERAVTRGLARAERLRKERA